ncbi:MAG TPA: CapA family protein, partial [Candidatus Paceibacterota bacterium]|nr:CapA family protein [Candidatus Paceibacterota bacterium]
MAYLKTKLIILTFAVAIILFIAASFLINPKTIEIFRSPVPEETENKTVSVILTGDIMLDRGVEYMIEKQEKADFKFPFLKIADYFKKADIIFGNLEGVISDKGTKIGSIYSFRVNPKAIEGLISAGFNVLSLANNHAFDYGKEALEDCLIRLENSKISYVGAGFNEKEAFSLVVKEINDTKIGFLAYTDLGPKIWRAKEENSGIAWIEDSDLEKIKKEIKEAKEDVDVLIVSIHSGEEYVQELTPFQLNFTKMAIEAGADLIVGHHPHVVQRDEKYEQKYIFYSLGNFIFDQSFSEQTMQSEIVEITIENKKIKEVTAKQIKI